MKEEVWKTTHISSYHEVSNFGRVRTIERTIRKILHHSRIISQSLNREGYPKVFLNTPNGEVTITVHRLVAIPMSTIFLMFSMFNTIQSYLLYWYIQIKRATFCNSLYIN